MTKRRKRKAKPKKEKATPTDKYRLSSEGLAADYNNHFLDLLVSVETMYMFEEFGEKDNAAEWRKRLIGLIKEFKTFGAYVSEKFGIFEPDKKEQRLNEISKEVPSCTSENYIDFKRLKELITEGFFLCKSEESASILSERADAAFSHYIR